MHAVAPLHPERARFEGGPVEVAPGVHAWLQPNGLLGESNACLVSGDGASLLVDTLWDPPLTRRMLAAMAPLTGQAPIATLVNSHSDGDHWWGNQELTGAEIVATEAAAAVMAEQSPAHRLLPHGAARPRPRLSADGRPEGRPSCAQGPGGAGRYLIWS